MSKVLLNGTKDHNGHRYPEQETNVRSEQPFDAALVASPVTLPCGRVLSNRLVKAATYEHLAAFSGGLPNRYHLSLYSRWARGGWGMIITGNCQISPSHLSLGRDMTFPPYETARGMDAFRALSAAMQSTGGTDTLKSDGALAIIQLSHSGRQSPRFIGGRLGTFCQPLSPLSQRVGEHTKEGLIAKIIYKLLFQTPRVILREEINDVVESFVNAAELAWKTGFDGVQLHAAHGYMLSQFLSPELSTREDEYSDPLFLLRQIIIRIRATTPSQFVLGIKLNAGDYVTGGTSEERALEHVRQLALLGIDFIEISGGDYENPDFMASASPRQEFFSSFSRRVVGALPTSGNKPATLVMLTGGLRVPSQFSEVILQNHAHLLGIGRLAVLCPNLPHRISPRSVSSNIDSFPLPEPKLFTLSWFPKLAGASIGTAWYVVAMRRLANRKEVDMDMGTLGALFWMWAWAGPDGFLVIVPWIPVIGLVVILFTLFILYRPY